MFTGDWPSNRAIGWSCTVICGRLQPAMCVQPKNMISIVAALGLAVVLGSVLGGCGQGRYGAAGSYQWSPPPRLAAGNGGSSSAVIVTPGRANGQFFGYAQGYAPEYDRRDASLNITENDPYAGWLGYPERERTSLEDQRSFYTSRSAERYTYPRVAQRPYNNQRSNNRRSTDRRNTYSSDHRGHNHR